MKQLSNNTSVFFALLRAGLWEQDVRLSEYEKIEFEEVMRLAEEQAVVGLITAGMEHAIDIKVPEEVLLQSIGQVLLLEQSNKEMNTFIGRLIEKMRKVDIYALLVKGQGIAQCYKRSLWREPGDVDLLLSNDNYRKAKEFLIPLASSVEDENTKALHLGLTVEQWVVELHGTLNSCSMPKMDRIINEAQRDVFYGGHVRSWMNGRTMVFMPSPDNDVIFVFTHILKHFYDGGIGLRQICDLCRLLWTYKDSLNQSLLESRIKRAGLMSEWKAFSALAVENLGMPEEAMPFFSSEKKWSRKAERIKNYIMELGNFGHKRDNVSKFKTSLFSQKMISLGLYTSDFVKQFRIFPLDSIKVWLRMICHGVSTVFNKRKNNV